MPNRCSTLTRNITPPVIYLKLPVRILYSMRRAIALKRMALRFRIANYFVTFPHEYN